MASAEKKNRRQVPKFSSVSDKGNGVLEEWIAQQLDGAHKWVGLTASNGPAAAYRYLRPHMGGTFTFTDPTTTKEVTVRLENGAFTHTLRLLKKANISADGLFDGSDPGAVAAFKNLGAACVEFVSKKYMGRSNPRLPNPQQLQVTWHAQAGKHSAYAALLASVRVCVQVDGSEEEETGLVLLNFNVGEAVAKNASEAEKAAAHARAVAKVTAGLSYLNLDLPVDNETFFMLWDFILGARGTSPLARVTMSVIEGAPCVFEKTHVYEDGTTKSFFVVHVAHRPRHWYGGTYSELSTARWVAALMALTRVGITTGHFTFEKLQNCGAIGATLTDLQVGHLFPQTKAFKALVEDTKSLTPVAVQAAMEGWAAAGVQLPAFRLYPDNRSTWEPPTAGQGGSPGAAAAGAGFGSSCTAASSSSAAAGGAASAASHSDAAGTTELNGTGAAWEPDVGGACSAADEDARSSLACSSAGAGRASGAILAAVSDASWSSARASAEVDGAAAVAAPPPSAPFGGPPSAEAVDPVERAVREMLPGATPEEHTRFAASPFGRFCIEQTSRFDRLNPRVLTAIWYCMPLRDRAHYKHPSASAAGVGAGACAAAAASGGSAATGAGIAAGAP